MALKNIRQQAIKRSPAESVRHMKSFKLNLKFSAGIWYFSPADSRFHAKYKKDLNLGARFEIAAKLKDYGLSALEAHYPDEVNEDNLHLWQKFEKDTGIRLITAAPSIFRDPKFEFGSTSNPNPKSHRTAVERIKKTLELNRAMNTDFAIVWPGIDGYENCFGIDFATMRDRFAEGFAEAMDAVPGIRIAFEPKPYEPRGHILYGTTAEGMLLCHKVEGLLKNQKNKRIIARGDVLCCLNPEIGHVLMGYEDLPYAYSWPLSEGRLAHIHLNSQPLGNYDQDLNIGVVAPEQFDALMYVLKMHGYDGYFGIDINPERMPVETAIKINIDAVRAANDRINALDYESITYVVEHPEKARGWLEAYLIRTRAINSGKLPPLPPLKK
ncbi:MAG: TIM barrel protein [Dehalococcoidales bacterium]|nr:TIM barrel protein [Dehalococcoidales bacterium]